MNTRQTHLSFTGMLAVCLLFVCLSVSNGQPFPRRQGFPQRRQTQRWPPPPPPYTGSTRQNVRGMGNQLPRQQLQRNIFQNQMIQRQNSNPFNRLQNQYHRSIPNMRLYSNNRHVPVRDGNMPRDTPRGIPVTLSTDRISVNNNPVQNQVKDKQIPDSQTSVSVNATYSVGVPVRINTFQERHNFQTQRQQLHQQQQQQQPQRQQQQQQRQFHQQQQQQRNLRQQQQYHQQNQQQRIHQEQDQHQRQQQRQRQQQQQVLSRSNRQNNNLWQTRIRNRIRNNVNFRRNGNQFQSINRAQTSARPRNTGIIGRELRQSRQNYPNNLMLSTNIINRRNNINQRYNAFLQQNTEPYDSLRQSQTNVAAVQKQGIQEINNITPFQSHAHESSNVNDQPKTVTIQKILDTNADILLLNINDSIPGGNISRRTEILSNHASLKDPSLVLNPDYTVEPASSPGQFIRIETQPITTTGKLLPGTRFTTQLDKNVVIAGMDEANPLNILKYDTVPNVQISKPILNVIKETRHKPMKSDVKNHNILGFGFPYLPNESDKTLHKVKDGLNISQKHVVKSNSDSIGMFSSLPLGSVGNIEHSHNVDVPNTDSSNFYPMFNFAVKEGPGLSKPKVPNTFQGSLFTFGFEGNHREQKEQKQTLSDTVILKRDKSTQTDKTVDLINPITTNINRKVDMPGKSPIQSLGLFMDISTSLDAPIPGFIERFKPAEYTQNKVKVSPSESFGAGMFGYRNTGNEPPKYDVLSNDIAQTINTLNQVVTFPVQDNNKLKVVHKNSNSANRIPSSRVSDINKVSHFPDKLKTNIAKNTINSAENNIKPIFNAKVGSDFNFYKQKDFMLNDKSHHTNNFQSTGLMPVFTETIHSQEHVLEHKSLNGESNNKEIVHVLPTNPNINDLTGVTKLHTIETQHKNEPSNRVSTKTKNNFGSSQSDTNTFFGFYTPSRMEFVNDLPKHGIVDSNPNPSNKAINEKPSLSETTLQSQPIHNVMSSVIRITPNELHHKQTEKENKKSASEHKIHDNGKNHLSKTANSINIGGLFGSTVLVRGQTQTGKGTHKQLAVSDNVHVSTPLDESNSISHSTPDFKHDLNFSKLTLRNTGSLNTRNNFGLFISKANNPVKSKSVQQANTNTVTETIKLKPSTYEQSKYSFRGLNGMIGVGAIDNARKYYVSNLVNKKPKEQNKVFTTKRPVLSKTQLEIKESIDTKANVWNNKNDGISNRIVSMFGSVLPLSNTNEHLGLSSIQISLADNVSQQTENIRRNISPSIANSVKVNNTAAEFKPQSTLSQSLTDPNNQLASSATSRVNNIKDNISQSNESNVQSLVNLIDSFTLTELTDLLSQVASSNQTETVPVTSYKSDTKDNSQAIHVDAILDVNAMQASLINTPTTYKNSHTFQDQTISGVVMDSKYLLNDQRVKNIKVEASPSSSSQLAASAINKNSTQKVKIGNTKVDSVQHAHKSITDTNSANPNVVIAPFLSNFDLGVNIDSHQINNVINETSSSSSSSNTNALLDDLLSGLNFLLSPDLVTTTAPPTTTTVKPVPCDPTSPRFKCKGKGMFTTLDTMITWCLNQCKSGTGCAETVCECGCETPKPSVNHYTLGKNLKKKTVTQTKKNKPLLSKKKALSNKRKKPIGKKTLRKAHGPRKAQPKRGKHVRTKQTWGKQRKQGIKRGQQRKQGIKRGQQRIRNGKRRLLSNSERQKQEEKPKPTTEEPPEIEWEDIVTSTTVIPSTTEYYHEEGLGSTISPFDDIKLQQVKEQDVRAERIHVKKIPQVYWASETRSRLAKLAKNTAKLESQANHWLESPVTTTYEPYPSTIWDYTQPITTTFQPPQQNDWPTARPVDRWSNKRKGRRDPPAPRGWRDRPADQWRDRTEPPQGAWRDSWSPPTTPPSSWHGSRQRHNPPPTYGPHQHRGQWGNNGWSNTGHGAHYNQQNNHWGGHNHGLRNSWGNRQTNRGNKEPTEAPDK